MVRETRKRKEKKRQQVTFPYLLVRKPKERGTTKASERRRKEISGRYEGKEGSLEETEEMKKKGYYNHTVNWGDRMKWWKSRVGWAELPEIES